jgi:malonate transporter and related proteins
MENLIIIFFLIVPVFLIVALGYLLKKKNVINSDFISASSKVVFTVSLPALIFNEVTAVPFSETLNLNLILYSVALTVITFLLVWGAGSLFIKEGKDLAVFIQGSTRGNFAIIGLAIIANIYGREIMGKASLVLAFIIPLYNLLSVIALTVPVRKEKGFNYIKLFKDLITNPLIIAILLAIPFSVMQIEIPNFLRNTIGYLASLTLPLALIGVGGFLSFTEAKKDSVKALWATIIKLVLIPLAGVYGAYLAGFRGEEMGILFILFGCPTAIASFIMADAMGVNSRLAGNILLLTTLGSILTITGGLYLLKINGII